MIAATEFQERISRLFVATGAACNSDLARLLGIQPQAIAGARKRGIIPGDWVEMVALNYSVSVDWLLFATEPVWVKTTPQPLKCSFQERFNRIRQATGARTDFDLSDILEIKPQSVSAARKRGRIPSSWIENIAEKYFVSAHWLLFGERGQILSLDSMVNNGTNILQEAAEPQSADQGLVGATCREVHQISLIEQAQNQYAQFTRDDFIRLLMENEEREKKREEKIQKLTESSEKLKSALQEAQAEIKKAHTVIITSINPPVREVQEPAPDNALDPVGTKVYPYAQAKSDYKKLPDDGK